MANVRQISFSSGEIAPALYGRVDLVKYATGLKTCRNFMVMRHGGVANRPGTQFITEVKDSTKKVRLIPFVFNASQTYVLEFGNLYMRVIKNGILLTSGGSPYEIVTPYVEADLPYLKYVQSADIITIAHPNYAPRELARTADTTWTLTAITFGPSIAAPTGLASDASGTTYYYKVATVNGETNEESLPTSAVGSSTQTSTLTWNAVTGAGYYNIYKLINGQYGWIGIAGAGASPSFKDATYTPDALDTPSVDRQPFGSTNNYPSTLTYYQQRMVFGNTNNNPEGVWTSRSALRKNLMVSTPIQDDDAVTFSMAGRQVNAVQHLLDIGKLVVFTTGGEWTINGDISGVLTPSNINPKQYTANGSGYLPPLVVDGTALYIQARGSVVRDLAYDFQTDGYKGNEVSIFSAHLFDGYTIVDWAYQQIPHSTVWAIRSDGALLGLTYVREHQVLGWHRHDFKEVERGLSTDYLADGTYTADGSISATGGTTTLVPGYAENICVVPEGVEDVPYLVIQRLVDGTPKRYIERMTTRQISDIRDAVFMDCTLSYDGRNTNGSHSLTLTGGTDWLYTEDLTLTSNTSYFSSGEVGNEYWLYTVEGDVIRCRVNAYVSPYEVTVNPNKTVPSGLRSATLKTWSRAVDEVSGLSHLEGKQVSIMADGVVSANPNSSSYEPKFVTSGIVTLDDPHVIIHVGLPVVADIETLNVDTPQGSSMSDKMKNITRLTMIVEKTRGVWAGPDSDNLTEFKLRNSEGYDDSVALKTGTVDLNITPSWNKNGQVFISQTDPLPVTILSITPAGFIAA